ncbi:MAG: hypothetical protein Q9162_003726 [Coniocarpon cinnabarinum]
MASRTNAAATPSLETLLALRSQKLDEFIRLADLSLPPSSDEQSISTRSPSSTTVPQLDPKPAPTTNLSPDPPSLLTMPSMAAHSRPLLHSETEPRSRQFATQTPNTSTTHPVRVTPHPQPSAEDARLKPALQKANQIIQTHIKLLHEYNAIRDAALGMMELECERRNVRLGEVMEELGVGKDE